MDKRPSVGEVKPFSFKSFEDSGPDIKSETKNFLFQDLSEVSSNSRKINPTIIRAERDAEAKTDFKIDNIVRDLRGLSAQEKDDLESKIGQEVEVRLRQIRDQAYREGLDKGRLEGADAALQEAMEKHQEQIQQVETMLVSLNQQYNDILLRNKSDVYEMIKRLMKWLVMKEVQTDEYLPKLIEKLVLEMGERHNLILRFNQADFSSMPSVVEAIQAKLGEMKNLRIEPETELRGRGLILESENNLIDGSMESLFATIDKMFASVVNHE